MVSIHMTSRGSGAYQAAVAAQDIAREMLPKLKIEVIDTFNVSMCHGWMVIEAAREALLGHPLSTIVAQVKALIPLTKMIQTADTLRYLYMGGRIGKAKHLVGTLLNIKPLISMEDGVIVPVRTARSPRPGLPDDGGKNRGRRRIHGKGEGSYVHATAREEAEKIRSMVEERIECVETIIAELSPALGVHTGPGTAGLCYYPVKSLI